MIPIQIWWFIVDVDTKRALHMAPSATLLPAIASRIHDAGGVLSETHFCPGDDMAGFELFPEDISWVEDLGWTPPPET